MTESHFIKEQEKFGARVKILRNSKGLTQLQLAERMHIERSEISKMENGKLNVEFRTIVKLARALEVEIKELFS